MPRRPWTAAERKAGSLRMKAAWRKKKRHLTQTTETAMNGDVRIPYHLARLLVAEPSEYNNPLQYKEVQGLAKSLLRILVQAKAK